MSDTVFIAVDLQGIVHNVALCEAVGGIEAAGWPVRSSIRTMHSWVANEDGDRNTVLAMTARWGVSLCETTLAMLSERGRDEACTIWQDAASIVLPRYRYSISPRGMVMAEQFRDYACDLPDKVSVGSEAIRSAFAPLFEQAAEDIQTAGFEQDDCVVDRYIVVRCAERGELAVALESLNDPEWMESSIRRAQETAWGEAMPCPTEVVKAVLRCPVEPPGVFPTPLAETDGCAERAVISGLAFEAKDGAYYERNRLLAGDGGRGPAAIKESATLIRVSAERAWHVTSMGHLVCR